MVRMPIKTFAVSAALALAMVLITVPLGGPVQASSPMDSWMMKDDGGSAWYEPNELPNPFERDVGDRCQWWRYELRGGSYVRTYRICRYGDQEIDYRRNVRALWLAHSRGLDAVEEVEEVEAVSMAEEATAEAEVPEAEAATAEATAAEETPAETTTAEATASGEYSEELAGADIVDTAAAASDFAAMLAVAGAADLAETLHSEGPFTIFLPNDAAFAELPEGLLDTLLDEPQGELAQIVLYHVVDGVVMSSDLTDGMELETLQGGTIVVTIDGDSIMVDEANLLFPDIGTTNGVIHVIDAVLRPTIE